MKWLFIVAVLLNISFFAYNSFFHEKANIEKSAPNSSEKNQLILLNELDANQLKALQNKSVALKTPEKSIEQTSLDQNSSQTDATNSSDELSVAGTNSPGMVIEQKRCFNLGPFNKNIMDEIKLILEKEYQNLLSFGIEPTSETTYFRIYIPPVENKEKRNETLALLDENGLKDHYVMSIDGRKNAIALGVFKKRSAAEGVALKTDKIGLATTIEAISDDKNSLYKLQLEFQDKANLDFYNELIQNKKIKSSKCEK